MEKEQEQRIQELRDKVNLDASQLDRIVDDIIKPYTQDLDNYVRFIREDLLQDGNNPPTAEELDDVCINLPVFIYSASSMQERLGIKEDISKALYKEMYHSARDNIQGGTVADKNSLAELASQEEYIISMLYKRAYKTVCNKVDAAQELLSSCKKVISRRMAEIELTRIGGQ